MEKGKVRNKKGTDLSVFYVTLSLPFVTLWEVTDYEIENACLPVASRKWVSGGRYEESGGRMKQGRVFPSFLGSCQVCCSPHQRLWCLSSVSCWCNSDVTSDVTLM